ncbi:MAG: hypothetical protein LC118_00910, partial [Dehalococcoidia bacterium]|nr:hypothetical protein [Dehalococcoidia bacterium]
GDAKFQEKCYDHISGLQAQGVTIVMVSHDLGAVERFSSRAALMERGRMIAIGEPERIVAMHLERLAESSPEIKRAIGETMEANPEMVEERIANDPAYNAAFSKALETNPEFQRAMAEKAVRERGE